MGFPVAIALQRWVYPRLGEAVRRLPWPTLRRLLLVEGDQRAPSGLAK